ncbi:MAG: YbaB/EbfC family nucleoid-associated protein, partial [Rhodospirillaceae bacterium]|nr:YbaB/EbfC family nucleoid-associated protein [Rhodospirillaceae bacterium]
IQPAAMDNDAETMEALVGTAFQDAHAKVAIIKQEMIDEMTGGLPLPPGIKLPF